MAVYAIGDIQGCFDGFLRILDMVGFDPDKDCLISTGDLVNRGSQSLETLRFCYELGDSFQMVLGNHDLHLLAIGHGHRAPTKYDTLDSVLSAPDRHELFDWLKRQPFLIDFGPYTIVHAGIPPQWSLETTRLLANELSEVLLSPQSGTFFENMYCNIPDQWSESLTGPARWRLIANYLTRMRRCSSTGLLDFSKTAVHTSAFDQNTGFAGWFEHPNRLSKDRALVFGHWSDIQGRFLGEQLFPLDTGYIWGGRLRIMNLDTQLYTHYDRKK
jgi:bis(5'-nucleosyl)-tetraphosphatase (symmetrical)